MELLNTIAIVLSTLAIIAIVAGLVFARNRKKHVPLMLAAFGFDMVGLVLVEFGPFFYGETDAVTGLATDPGVIKSVHALLSTIAVVGYILQIISGKKILAGDRTKLISHKKVAKLFLVTRFAAYVTMFMID